MQTLQVLMPNLWSCRTLHTADKFLRSAVHSHLQVHLHQSKVSELPERVEATSKSAEKFTEWRIAIYGVHSANGRRRAQGLFRKSACHRHVRLAVKTFKTFFRFPCLPVTCIYAHSCNSASSHLKTFQYLKVLLLYIILYIAIARIIQVL